MPANCCGFSSSSQAVVGLLSFVLQQPEKRDETFIGSTAYLKWLSLVRCDPLSVMQCFDPSLPKAQRRLRHRESVGTALAFKSVYSGY